MNATSKTESTFQSALQNATSLLAERGIASPRSEASLLLAYVLGIPKEKLILHPEKEITGSEEEDFLHLVERRCQREPVAYLTGQQEFWSLAFDVNPQVLIPRPETEGVIEQLIRWAGATTRDRELSILDVGTGSGILAVTAAVEFSKARVTAIDISPEALAVARTNAQRHRVADRIDFILHDMTNDWPLPEGRRYDFILSNPPYIPSGEMAGLMPDVRDYEPVGALDGGPDGLSCYRSIIPNALADLKQEGGLILEVGDGQAEDVASLLEACQGFQEIVINQDLSGRGRVVFARRTHG